MDFRGTGQLSLRRIFQHRPNREIFRRRILSRILARGQQSLRRIKPDQRIYLEHRSCIYNGRVVRGNSCLGNGRAAQAGRQSGIESWENCRASDGRDASRRDACIRSFRTESISLSHAFAGTGDQMTLLITEADVRSLLTMPIALEIVEDSLRRQGNGELILNPRRRIQLPDHAILNYMAAADSVRGYIGMKIYTVARGGARF